MNSPFKTFFMGGYECADHLNRQGTQINLLKETKHDVLIDEDYKLLSEMGISVVREGICWSNVEKEEGRFDFSEVRYRMQVAKKYGIQQVWDLIHFGYPDGLFPTHPQFCMRFEKLCTAFEQFYQLYTTETLMVIPINEISFLSWFSGENRGTTPYAVHNGWDIKYHLCKAAIVGMKALRSLLPHCRIVMAEPLVKIHSNGVASDEEVRKVNDYQYQAMDIISGRMCPELGGEESFLDILGFNYYWNCQWRIHGETLPWPEEVKLRVPLSELISEVYERYNRPLFLAETGHFGIGRIPWIEEVTQECIKAVQSDVPFLGLCIYPVTDRPDWDNLSSYSNCGIFDLDAYANRIPYVAYIKSIMLQHQLFKEATLIKNKQPVLA